jgi:hypothetical protein
MAKREGKIWKYLASALKAADLYSEPVTLLLQKKERSSTSVGMCVSLSIFKILAFSTISFVRDLLTLANPKVISSIVSTPNPPVKFIIIIDILTTIHQESVFIRPTYIFLPNLQKIIGSLYKLLDPDSLFVSIGFSDIGKILKKIGELEKLK